VNSVKIENTQCRQ